MKKKKNLGWEAIICSWGLFRGSRWELLYHNESKRCNTEEVCGPQGKQKETKFGQLLPLHHCQPMNILAHPRTSCIMYCIDKLWLYGFNLAYFACFKIANYLSASIILDEIITVNPIGVIIRVIRRWDWPSLGVVHLWTSQTICKDS